MVIDREDMLELTRRMTLKRNCFTRIAGAYIDDEGEVEGTFNVNFLNLKPFEKTKNLELAKTIPFSVTNIQLKRYEIPDKAKGINSMYMLLNALNDCHLKNDALMDVFYEQVADGYPVDYNFAVFLFTGTYDVPTKGNDKNQLGESEEVYDFLICTVSPLTEEGEPDKPDFGFLYPAFINRSSDSDFIDIFHANPDMVEEGLMYKLLEMRTK